MRRERNPKARVEVERVRKPGKPDYWLVTGVDGQGHRVRTQVQNRALAVRLRNSINAGESDDRQRFLEAKIKMPKSHSLISGRAGRNPLDTIDCPSCDAKVKVPAGQVTGQCAACLATLSISADQPMASMAFQNPANPANDLDGVKVEALGITGKGIVDGRKYILRANGTFNGEPTYRFDGLKGRRGSSRFPESTIRRWLRTGESGDHNGIRRVNPSG